MKEIFNKSQSFILPCLGLSTYDLDRNGFKECYLGDFNVTSTDDWGDNIFLLFDTSKLSDEFLTILKESEQYSYE